MPPDKREMQVWKAAQRPDEPVKPLSELLRTQYRWRTKDGRILELHQLEDVHLRNILGAVGDGRLHPSAEKLQALQDEASRRGPKLPTPIGTTVVRAHINTGTTAFGFPTIKVTFS